MGFQFSVIGIKKFKIVQNFALYTLHFTLCTLHFALYTLSRRFDKLNELITIHPSHILALQSEKHAKFKGEVIRKQDRPLVF